MIPKSLAQCHGLGNSVLTQLVGVLDMVSSNKSQLSTREEGPAQGSCVTSLLSD